MTGCPYTNVQPGYMPKISPSFSVSQTFHSPLPAAHVPFSIVYVQAPSFSICPFFKFYFTFTCLRSAAAPSRKLDGRFHFVVEWIFFLFYDSAFSAFIYYFLLLFNGCRIFDRIFGKHNRLNIFYRLWDDAVGRLSVVRCVHCPFKFFSNYACLFTGFHYVT